MHAENIDAEGAAFVAKVAACRVLDVGGRPVRLYDAWRGKPVVHAFIRQFGCLFCHQMVAGLLESAADIGSRGGHIVMVGCGSPEQAGQFARDKRIPREHVTIYTDPSRAAFEAASLGRGYDVTFFDRGARRAYVRARRDGFAITGVQGDVVQLGGLMVVRPPARLAYLHRSSFAGDHPPMSDVVAAV